MVEKKAKTNVYDITNKKNGYYLGEVKWYGPWRQYCFFPENETLYERKCLKAIIRFIDTLMSDRKVNKGQKNINDILKTIKPFKKEKLKKGTTDITWGLGSGHIIE